MTALGQQLINIVRAKAAENPGHVYESPIGGGSCIYVHNGCPSCLIGQALFEAGLIDASIERTINNGRTVTMLLDTLDLKLDPEERVWLREVQRRQDQRWPWGEAVIGADKYMLCEPGTAAPLKTWNVA